MLNDATVGYARQWHEVIARPFTREERDSTTLWMGGLSRKHDLFICAAARSRGYDMRPMPVPDNEALKIGKEFGNRGQCNPTYYTAGNLIRKLRALEASGVPREDLLRDYVYITAGSCGPCRFGMYSTEYRKVLRDAGYEGFRVLELHQTDIVRGDLKNDGLEVTLPFLIAIVKAAVAADVLNLIGHRIRPYEVNAGETDKVLGECGDIVIEALEQRRSVLRALRGCRRLLKNIVVDRLRSKPVVCVIGEIWAMTTEGDGNYKMHSFLEDEGAEVLIQPIFNWLLYLIWEQKRDASIRRLLRGEDTGNRDSKGKSQWWQLMVASMAEPVLRQSIRSFAAAVGLTHPHLADIVAMSAATHRYYDSEIRGGEAFMEVGKFMDAAHNKLAHLVISVKPFGCLPSSGVSDGIQSLVSAHSPDCAFYAVETTGDGKVSVHSRIQMMLFNARKRAQSEFEQALERAGIDADEAHRRLRRDPVRRSASYHPHHCYVTTAANMVAELSL
jgi:predicted nucleotide-binding protein (sugar kinase/HSP70/actin superfamily)